ncbi:MAG: pitrilysin family protein [Anaerolineales bacterium]|jgi:zinc protease
MHNSLAALPSLDRSSLPGPNDVRRHELPNGVVVLARENFASSSFVISGYLPAGSISEGKEQAGLAAMTALALTRGTKQHAFQEIYESVESLGASLSLGAGKHSTSFFIKGLAEDLDTLLALLVEVLRHPSFPKAQIERLRSERLTGLAIRDQATGARAQMAFHDLAYPNHPYSIPVDGYQETVAALNAADLRAFHRQHYAPGGMVLAVVGALEADKAVDAVEASLSDWRRPQQTLPAELPALQTSKKSRRHVALPEKSQSDLILGCPGPSRFDPDYLSASLGNSILGSFGLMGRLGESLREEAGLAYYAYSKLGGGPGPGPWQVVVGVDPANLDRAIELALKEIGRFVRQRVSEEELGDNKANFIGRLPLQMESNVGVAGSLLRIERYRLGLDYYHRYPDLVAGITREQVLKAAKRFLDPASVKIGSAGPKARSE